MASIDLTPTRAETDHKEYLLTRLSNGLEVLLIADTDRINAVAAEDSFEDDDDEGEDQNGDQAFSEEEEGMPLGGEDDRDQDAQQGSNAVPMSAVAMAVGAGSFDECAGDAHGLAHFLEHMLFMGSKKYPSENAYDEYLAKHGGFSNAYTDGEVTVYYFEVAQAGLHHAMDVFAQFFIDPIMSPDALQREMEAVDSEFELSRADDGDRVREVLSISAKPGHPYARNTCGNLGTLRALDIGVLQQQLRAFHAKHYRIPNMKLCVWGVESMESLKQSVETVFSAIPTNPSNTTNNTNSTPAPPTTTTTKDTPFSADGNLGHLFRIVPVNDAHHLRFTWQLPPCREDYKARAHVYVSHLVGHECRGSALYLLKSLGWALELEAGLHEQDGFDSSSYCSLFVVDVKLTLAGVEKWTQVAAVVYAYLGMLKRTCCGDSPSAAVPPRWIFDEIACMDETGFRFRDEGDPSEECSELAVLMLPANAVERTDLLRAQHVLYTFDENGIQTLIRRLVDEVPHVDFLSSAFGREASWNESATPPSDLASHGSFAASPPQVESRLGTRFWSEPLDAQVLKQWKTAAETGELPFVNDNNKTALALALPVPNEFMPRDLRVKKIDLERAASDAEGAKHELVGAKVLVISTQNANARRKKKKNQARKGYPAEVLAARIGGHDNNKVQLLLRSDGGITEWLTIAQPVDHTAEKDQQKQHQDGNRVDVDDDAEEEEEDDDEEEGDIKGGMYVLEGRRLLYVTRPAMPPAPLLLLPSSSSSPSSSDTNNNNNNVRMWHLQETTFRVPRASLNLLLRTPLVNASASNRAMADLLAATVLHTLNEQSYLAGLAGMDLSLRADDEGFVVGVHGFSDRLLSFLLLALRAFLHVAIAGGAGERIDVVRMERENLARLYRNCNAVPEKQANAARLHAVVPSAHDALQLLAALDAFRFLEDDTIHSGGGDGAINSINGGGNDGAIHPSVGALAAQLLQGPVEVEALFHGNCTREDAHKASVEIAHVLRQGGVRICAAKSNPRPAVLKLPVAPKPSNINHKKNKGKKAQNGNNHHALDGLDDDTEAGCQVVVVQPSEERSESNNAVHIYFQLAEDHPRVHAHAELLEMLMQEPLFDDLRTHQQVGYIVACSVRRTHGVLGFSIEITSSKFAPSELERRVFAFLRKFLKEDLAIIDDEDNEEGDDLQSRAEALAERFMQRDTGLHDVTKRHWGEITSRHYLFNERALLAHELTKAPHAKGRFIGLDGDAFIDFCHETFHHASRRCMSIWIVGGKNAATTVEKEQDVARKAGKKVCASPKEVLPHQQRHMKEKEGVVWSVASPVLDVKEFSVLPHQEAQLEVQQQQKQQQLGVDKNSRNNKKNKAKKNKKKKKA